MTKIRLRGGGHALVSPEDLAEIAGKPWRIHSNGYVAYGLGRKTIYLHRVVAQTPQGLHTDHINRNKLDNRRENLRACSAQENAANGCYGPKRFGLRGVYRSGRNWIAKLRVDRTELYLGTFSKKKEAAEAVEALFTMAYGGKWE